MQEQEPRAQIDIFENEGGATIPEIEEQNATDASEILPSIELEEQAIEDKQ